MLRVRFAILPAVPLVVASLLWAQSTATWSWPETSVQGVVAHRALSVRLQQDLKDGRLDQFTLFEAALIAGGLESNSEVERRTIQFNQLKQSLANELKGIADSPCKLDRILRRLHERLLYGEYRAESSELSQTLEDGHYNCVTATILFLALGEGCGLELRAIAAESHVLCCLHGTPKYFVETTCRNWRSVGWDACPQRTQELVREGRELSPAQLLGKIYYNRGVSRLEDNCFDQAAGLFQTATQLDPQDPAARENLLATYNNWALAECDEGRFFAAKELLLRGLAIDPAYAPLLANDLHIHQKWVNRLCDAGDFSTAIEVLEQGYLRRPDSELFDRGRIAVQEIWAKHGQLDLLQTGL